MGTTRWTAAERAGARRWIGGAGQRGESRRRRRLLGGSLAASLLLAGGSGLVAAAPVGAATTGFTATGSLHTARADATATVLGNGDVLVAGGEDANGTPTASAELYDPANGAWTVTGPLPLPVSRATATLLANGDVLVAGGLTGPSGNVVPTDASELYDPATGRWSKEGTLAAASFGASAALLSSGEVLYAGGLTAVGSGGTATKVAELYDPANGTWAATDSLPLGVAYAAAARLSDGRMLVAGGETGASSGLTTLAEVYQASTHTWAAVDHLPTAVAKATATVLGTGDVLVAGGETSSAGAPTGAAQRFDPSTGHWSTVGSLPFASYAATATLLPGGQVLYAGGFASTSGDPTAKTALYDPSSATWAAGPNLLLARGEAVAARLGNGDVLVAGGRTSSGVTAEAERLATGVAPAFTTPATVSLRAGVYTAFTIRATGTPVPTLSLSGTLPPGMAFHASTDGTATIYGTPYPSVTGTYVVTVTATNAVGTAVQHLSLVLERVPVFTSPDTRTLRAGVFTDVTVTTTGTPTPTLALYGTLPPDLTFRANANGTGTIYGLTRPGLTGTYVVTITARNTVGTAVQHLSLAFEQPPAITSPDRLTVEEGHPVSFTIRATGTPTPTLSLQGTLPSGLSFHPETDGTATLSGTPATGTHGTYTVTVVASNGVGSPATQELRLTVTPLPRPVDPRGAGYWYTTSYGEVIAKGAARVIAPRTPQHPRQIVGMAAMPDQGGYYLVSSYGGVFNYGNAPFFGSIAARHLRTATVAIAVAPSGDGYYEVTRAGNVFNFGRAPFYGSTAGRGLPPIAAFALTPDGHGYWLVSVHGNVYAFGDARFFGSPARLRIPAVAAFAPTPDGLGYWVVTVSGSVLTYGNAVSYGSLAGRRVPPVVAFARTRTGQGYWIVTRAGNVFDLGDAAFHGSSAQTRLYGSVTGFAPVF